MSMEFWSPNLVYQSCLKEKKKQRNILFLMVWLQSTWSKKGKRSESCSPLSCYHHVFILEEKKNEGNVTWENKETRRWLIKLVNKVSQGNALVEVYIHVANLEKKQMTYLSHCLETWSKMGGRECDTCHHVIHHGWL